MKPICAVASAVVACVIALTTATTAAAAHQTTPAQSKPTTSIQSYNSATNLNAYINQLRLAPNTSGDLYVAEAKAISECGIFVSAPSYADVNIKHYERLKDTGYPYAQTMINMYERLNKRCQDFISTMAANRTSTVSLSSTISSLYVKAADEGNAEAVAHNLLLRVSSGGMDSSTVLVRTLGIIRTRNPAAIFELSLLFGNGGPLRLTNNAYLDPKLSIIAWRFVACDLGYDCATSSALNQQQCLSIGLCGTGDYRENIRQSRVTPSQFTEIIAIENQLLSAINNGSFARLIATTTQSSESSAAPLCTQQPAVTSGIGGNNGGSASPLLPICGGGSDEHSIDASAPPYNTTPALRGVGIASNYSVRVAGDSQATGWYVVQHGLGSLRSSSIYEIKYQDKTSEYV